MTKTSAAARPRGPRGVLGPALLIVAPLQFLAGDALLRHFPVRSFNFAGALGLMLVFASLLVLIAGLGESGSLIARRFSGE